MKAIVVIDGEEIKVEGTDLTITTNMISNELAVFDKATESQVFVCSRSAADYAYIVPGGDAE
jgi:hypothetical protein